ncbi:two-component system response regulator [Oceanobacillus sp. E9]|uniref:response regulator n=1 Tax=Oceanobacillus TaxID=182709 RepID=UPI00084E4C94|nr:MULTISPECIES: response regulator [Oceanobacillus]OEH53340.1 two-component system response regulator [Oceanobacillus sp. E9]
MSSYRILIVDDEPIIRLGLQQTIPWGKYQIDKVEIACDGLDAIRIIDELGGIDLVLSDVRMPNMDGLQLASYLHKNHPQTKTMLISGYDEFAYAKKAIQSGVKDYLLKPVDINELESKVNTLVNELEEEHNVKNESRQKEIKNTIFQQVYHFPEDTVNPNRYLDNKIYPFISTVKEYDKQTAHLSEQGLASFNEQWKDTIEQTTKMLGFDTVSIFVHCNQLLTCLIQPIDSEINPIQVAEIIKDKHSFSFIWSDSVINVMDLKNKYNQLKTVYDYLPLIREHDVIFSNYQMDRPDMQTYPYKIEKELIDTLFHRKPIQHNQVGKKITDLFDYFRSHSFLLQEVQEVCSHMLKVIMKEYEALLGEISVKLDCHFLKELDLILFNSYSSIQYLFEQDLELIIKKLAHHKIEKADWLIKQAEEYIKEYFRTTIKVQEVADVINVSSNYFSTLFKQKTGENFNEYVNKLRVDEAKSLLINTPFKVSEISRQVGFQEYKYFVSVFKKFSGLTPTNYRKLTAIE